VQERVQDAGLYPGISASLAEEQDQLLSGKSQHAMKACHGKARHGYFSPTPFDGHLGALQFFTIQNSTGSGPMVH
jgi:hypothetical protein